MPSTAQMDINTPVDPLAWSGATENDLRHCIVNLQDADIAEVKAALESWKDSMNGAAGSVSQQTFPLPSLASRLMRLARSVHEGSGFAVLRGLDTKQFSAEDNMVIYLGVCSWVGNQRGRRHHTQHLLQSCSYDLEHLLSVCTYLSRCPKQEA